MGVSRAVSVQASYQAAIGPPAFCFLALPAVTPGKIWEVLRIGVTSPDPFTSLTGVGVTALAYRSAFVPQDSNKEPSSFGDLISVLGVVPSVIFSPHRAVLIRGSERVIFVFQMLPSLQQIQASMDVIEHDTSEFMRSLNVR
jgi:hypothetical protein